PRDGSKASRCSGLARRGRSPGSGPGRSSAFGDGGRAVGEPPGSPAPAAPDRVICTSDQLDGPTLTLLPAAYLVSSRTRSKLIAAPAVSPAAAAVMTWAWMSAMLP